MKLYMLKENNERIQIDAVTSDQHFGHDNILKYTPRPFDTIDEMNQKFIELWNSVVGENDTVLHLGDAALGLLSESLKNYGQCNGRKFLISGNHESISVLKSKNYRAKNSHLYDEYFTVLPEPPLELVAVDDHGNEVTLYASHYPHDDHSGFYDKYVKHGLLVPKEQHVLHGHTHHASIGGMKDGVLEYHVGVDAHEYKPVKSEEILSLLFGK